MKFNRISLSSPRAQKQIIVLMCVLILSAVGMWSWYFLTRPMRPVFVMQTFPVRPSFNIAPMRNASEKERKAAVTSIRAQLQAFRTGDFKKAASYQSKALKNNFPTLADFERMMKGSYPQFVHSKDAKFGPARASVDGKIVEVPAVIIGNDSQQVTAVYQMVLEEGSYRVAGVQGGSAGHSGIPAPQTPAGMEEFAPLVT